MDGWKISFLLGRPIFRGYVKLRGGSIFPFSVLFGSRGIEPTGRRVNHGKTPPEVANANDLSISGGQVLCFLDGISLALLEICSTWWRRLVAWRNHFGDTCVFFHLPFG